MRTTKRDLPAGGSDSDLYSLLTIPSKGTHDPAVLHSSIQRAAAAVGGRNWYLHPCIACSYSVPTHACNIGVKTLSSVLCRSPCCTCLFLFLPSTFLLFFACPPKSLFPSSQSPISPLFSACLFSLSSSLHLCPVPPALTISQKN